MQLKPDRIIDNIDNTGLQYIYNDDNTFLTVRFIDDRDDVLMTWKSKFFKHKFVLNENVFSDFYDCLINHKLNHTCDYFSDMRVTIPTIHY